MNPVVIIILIAFCFASALNIVLIIDNSYKVFKFKKNVPLLPERFTVTAHTGCLKTESNSVESMKKGVEAGADIIEFDLRYNLKGEPVLSHDAPSDRAVPLAEAFAFLAENKKIKANIDVKDTSHLDTVCSLAAEYGVTSRIFFTGISAKSVSAVERFCPQIPFYLNYSVNVRGKRDFAYISHIVETVENCGAVGINIHFSGASKELVEAFHDAGLLVSLWTANTVIDICTALSFAPDNITTKNPDRVFKLLEKYPAKKG